MNYKLFFPTYRNRWQFVKQSLNRHRPADGFVKTLHLGCGEGDYDPIIAQHCNDIYSCDINEADIAFAKQLNADLSQIHYHTEDALRLSHADETFDFVMSLEVIEHVGNPAKMLSEIYRVAKPGALIVMSFPQQAFPITYDPINLILSVFGRKRYFPFGAYGYGHDYLINTPLFRKQIADLGFELIEERTLTSYLSSIVELYWPSALQKILKPNSGNHTTAAQARAIGLRPSRTEPWIAYATDGLNAIDTLLFSWTGHSVNKGFVFRKVR
jgi:ubiquinone/menaquinone biosynthesis C-methylase UbiE